MVPNETGYAHEPTLETRRFCSYVCALPGSHIVGERTITRRTVPRLWLSSQTCDSQTQSALAGPVASKAPAARVDLQCANALHSHQRLGSRRLSLVAPLKGVAAAMATLDQTTFSYERRGRTPIVGH